MFSSKMLQFIEESFQKTLPYLDVLSGEILSQLASCPDEEQIILKFYYGSMPYSDITDVDFDLLIKYARHALYIRRNLDWCAWVPEQIFLTDVAAYRINNEKITDCRSFFYKNLIDRIKGLSMEEAALEVNYWCAENATYQASDFRTASPITVYLSGKGRCGEESVFLVSALRSIGIPARQVYTPRWAHCDSNHAWVEIWCNEKWKFLGACEPEPVLNKGWFTGPASRAMLIHCRYFTNIPVPDTISRDGMVTFTNNTGLYAKTVLFEVKITDRDGRPLPGTEVRFELLNSAIYTPIAIKKTDAEGKAALEMGKGSLRLHIRRGGIYQAENVSTEWGQVQIVFDGKCMHDGQWYEYELKAPKETLIHPGRITKKQAEENAQRMEKANKIREDRIASYYNEEKAVKYPDAAKLLKDSAGNFDEVFCFLDKDDNPYRIAMLKVLSGKDLLDLEAERLEEHLAYACIYADRYINLEKDVFCNYILNPRIEYEELTCYRKFINEFFTPEQKEMFIRNPRSIWQYIEREIGYDETRDYGTLRISPAGALRLKLASMDSKRILFAAICRSLGIPARLNPVDGTPEYYEQGKFVQAGKEKDEGRKADDSSIIVSSSLVLSFACGQEWKYYVTWTLGHLVDGIFETLNLEEIPIKDNRMELKLEPGQYRLLVTNRMPSGNQMVRECCFTLRDGDEREITLEQYGELSEDILIKKNIGTFAYRDRQGNTYDTGTDSAPGRRVYIWLEEGKEPTEHVLNEIIEEKNIFEPIISKVKLLVKDWSAVSNPTLKYTLEAVKGLQCYVPLDWGQADGIARQLDMEEGRLPLALVMDEENLVIYATGGYNAGSVNQILKMLNLH